MSDGSIYGAGVAWTDGREPFAYVPRRLLVRGQAALDQLDRLTNSAGDRTDLGGRDEAPESSWWLAGNLDDELELIEQMRADGFDAQPDHILFAHCDPCCGPHPAETYDALSGDPYRSNPYRSNPYRSNPYRSNPYRSNPYRSNSTKSSARPAAGRSFPERELGGLGDHPRITIVDTGLAVPGLRPALLDNPNRFLGNDDDEPDVDIVDPNGTQLFPQDGWLDPVAGHGTFIAGIIEQLAPGSTLTAVRCVQPLGDVRESDVITALLGEANKTVGQRPAIINCSFGGTVLARPAALQSAIAKCWLRGIVVVASAGNDASSEKQYPAAFDNVVAVGAVGPEGPAPWTNYGSWVDACAPGLDLVSAFFDGWNGNEDLVNTEDTDDFHGWARWSGTSFAAPVVVAALAREMVMSGCTAKDAVKHVIDAPESLRIRCLGTVVSA